MSKILQERRPSKTCSCDDVVGLDVLYRSSYAATAKGDHPDLQNNDMAVDRKSMRIA
jgi:hypothetical protein